MKKLLLLITFFSLPLFSQNQHSFTYENNQLEWIKVFESSLSITEIKQIIKSKGMFKSINLEDNLIKGEVENIKCDYENLGKSSWTTSFYIQNSNMNFSFYLKFKEGRYGVILNNIQLKTIDELSTSNITVMSSNAITPLSDYAIRKGKFRKGFLKSDAEIFEFTLTNLFKFNNYKKNSDDW
tara:strand:+ start:167 stop:712 length:546 start_codon:yes stop_codon:yes gene_type:complete